MNRSLHKGQVGPYCNGGFHSDCVVIVRDSGLAEQKSSLVENKKGSEAIRHSSANRGIDDWKNIHGSVQTARDQRPVYDCGER